jgi:hypothetical protein
VLDELNHRWRRAIDKLQGEIDTGLDARGWSAK